MSGLWLASYIALWILFLATAIALVSALRNIGDLAEALKNLSVAPDSVTLATGEATPTLTLQTFDGTTLATSHLQGQQTTYAIISPSCGPCLIFIDALVRGDMLDVFPTSGRRVIISTASASETQTLLKGKLPSDVMVLIDTDNQATEGWGARSTPTFITLDTDGQYLTHTVGFKSSPSKQRQHKSQSKVQPQLH